MDYDIIGLEYDIIVYINLLTNVHDRGKIVKMKIMKMIMISI